MRVNSVLISIACLALSACGQSSPPASPTTVSTAATTASLPHLPPQRIGDCVNTSVTQVGSRLEGAPNSGSAILYANGVSQVSYDAVPGIDHSKPGDGVRLCLVSLPQNCPPGDERGKIYAASNQRTNEAWQAPDAEHMCGGA
jgi:hypothetical protein